jgi:hypothetical protein
MIKKFKQFNESQSNSHDDIIDYIEANTSFTFNNSKDDEKLFFRTRDNGDVGSETHSDIDYQEGIELIKDLKVKYGNKPYSYSIEAIDEWVCIEINKDDFYDGYEPDYNKVGYVFSYKEKSGRGHSWETVREAKSYKRDDQRQSLREFAIRYIYEMKPDEVVKLADELLIPGGYKYSEPLLIQKAHGKTSGRPEGTWKPIDYNTIPDADFYVTRREIW